MDLRCFVSDGLLTPLQVSDCFILKGLAVDSRKVVAGGVFFAVPGHTVDGADYISIAVEKGAGAIIVSDDIDLSKIQPYLDQCLFFKTSNVRKAAGLIAECYYQNKPQKCVAVTGTNGKTSIVTLLRQMWAQLGIKAASMGTLGIQIEGQGEIQSEINQGSLTSPDVLDFYQTLADLKNKDCLLYTSPSPRDRG